jgi:hypothetical protein
MSPLLRRFCPEDSHEPCIHFPISRHAAQMHDLLLLEISTVSEIAHPVRDGLSCLPMTGHDLMLSCAARKELFSMISLY